MPARPGEPGGLPAGGAHGNELQAAAAAEIAHLFALQQALADARAVTELGRELAASRPLAVLGHRISAPLAEYFAYAARRIHPDVRCLTFGGSVVFDALLHVSEAGGRCLLAIALPRYPAETVQALRFARRLGMRTAVITDVPFVPFAGDADVLLTAGVGSGLVFDSHAARQCWPPSSSRPWRTPSPRGRTPGCASTSSCRPARASSSTADVAGRTPRPARRPRAPAAARHGAATSRQHHGRSSA